MKIEIFDKALSLLLGKVALVKTKQQEQVQTSYFVNLKEAYTDTTYLYVLTESGKEALYLCPGYKLIAGEGSLDKESLKRLPTKSYKNRTALTREEPTERRFYQLLNDYRRQRSNNLFENRHQEAFSYLQSLYYRPNENYQEAFNRLYALVKKECDNLGIVYETDPERIIEQKLESLKEDEEHNLINTAVCKSKESIDKYYQENILSCTSSKKLSFEISNLQFIRSSYTMSYPGEFLSMSDNLISALNDRNYPNRESILKNYLEFFISKDLAFSLTTYVDNLISKADTLQYEMDKKRFNSNFKFMEDLENIIKHNPDEETFRYHATTSLPDAKRILEEGFYSYSKDLGSTSFAEFDINQILSYSYGNGVETFGDYIIILSEPAGEDIVEELTEEEQEKVQIIPRRNAIIGNKPPYKVDRKHVVGIIDKNHEQVIINEEYLNNRKKQINI